MHQSITLLCFSLLLSAPVSAYALNCGGLNQPPCKVGERAPSCNKNLRVVGGKCVKFIRSESMRIMQGISRVEFFHL